MEITSIGIKKIAELICDDSQKYDYRTKKDLEGLFYGNVTNDDFYQEDLSRKNFCIKALNRLLNLEKLLRNICDERNFKNEGLQREFIDELNMILNVDNINVEKIGRNIKISIFQNQDSIIKSDLPTQEILSIEYIDEQIGKAQEKILNSDYSGAITNARTLLEHIIRDLCSNMDIVYQESNPKKSFDELRKKMNLNPQNYEEEGFKKIITGLINSIDGIFEVRNKCSDSHSRRYNPSKHHAKLCVNGVLTVSEFLVESYLYQKREGKN